ncbi:MAG: hypothetical protein J6V25_02645 [Oscillospiraceae bacterium]|nr:hypothetical protein [Oscillospiraceae bacterium]
MNCRRNILSVIIMILLGALLLWLGSIGVVDEFWSGMGFSLLMISLLRVIRTYRLHKNEAYREQTQVAATDERNKFIRGKAWAWTGYLFCMITAVSVIILKILGQDDLSLAASYVVCLMLIMHWGLYWLLSKKY